MTVERDNQDIVIRLKGSSLGMEEAQRIADYFRLIESNAQNQGTQEDADALARASHKDWIKENGYRFAK